jgi:predicted ArsR family transcriptional regulator
VYDVTPDAQDLFPSGYDALATGLLAAILEVGGDDLLRDVFAARRRQAADAIRRRFDERAGPDAGLPARVRELAVLQDELGYLADVELDDGVLRLVQHNCALAHVVAGTAAACDAELDLFRAVLGADVTRVRHLASGDRCCAYRITPTEA